MQTQAIKLESGWLIKSIPGFESIDKDVVNVNIQLADNQPDNLDYQSLKGIVLMDRYLEKRSREVLNTNTITNFHEAFSKQFSLMPGQLSEFMRAI